MNNENVFEVVYLSDEVVDAIGIGLTNKGKIALFNQELKRPPNPNLLNPDKVDRLKEIHHKLLAEQDEIKCIAPKQEEPDMSWLNEPEPKSPNDYKLSRRQENALIVMHENERPGMTGLPTAISIGTYSNQFYQRLERRGLVECVERAMEGGKHKIYWKLTSAGRGTAINLDDLPF